MGTKLRVTEYMPPSLTWIGRAVKAVLVIALVAVILTFRTQLDHLAEKKQEYLLLEQKCTSFKMLLNRGQECFKSGEYAESEHCYGSAMELLPNVDASYLGIAKVFIKVKEYEKALEVLERYSGTESGEIEFMKCQLLELINSLKQSVMH